MKHTKIIQSDYQMANLVGIPEIVNTLVTFFTMGGTDASIELIKGISVNGAMKLAELKDDLIIEPAVQRALIEFQQNPLNADAKVMLEEQLLTALEKHPLFQQMTAHVEGNIEATNGSVSAAIISGNVTTTNHFK